MTAPLLDLSIDEFLSTTRTVRKRLDFTRPVERPVVGECISLVLQAPDGARIEPACAVLRRDDKPVTFTSLAAQAGISRTRLYRDPSLRAVVDEHRTAASDPARSPSSPTRTATSAQPSKPSPNGSATTSNNFVDSNETAVPDAKPTDPRPSQARPAPRLAG